MKNNLIKLTQSIKSNKTELIWVWGWTGTVSTHIFPIQQRVLGENE
jgi:hypothetical protein